MSVWVHGQLPPRVNPGNAVLLRTAAKAVHCCCVSCRVVQNVVAVNLTRTCKSSLCFRFARENDKEEREIMEEFFGDCNIECEIIGRK